MKILVWIALASSIFLHSAKASLVSYLKFDGDINNVGVSKCNSRIYGKIAYADGISGKCLDLTADGNNAVILDGSENLIDGLKAFSVCFWYKGKLEDNAPWAAIVSKNGENKQGWQIRFNNHEGGGCFTVKGNGKNSSNNCFGYAKIADNRWHHIAGIFDDGLVSLYVDGILEDVIDGVKKPCITETPIVIGGKIARGKKGPDAFSKGMVDELQLYDEALDSKQIKELSNYDRLIGLQFIEMYKQFGVYPIQSHRGGGIEVPEHTIETYEQTWNKHAIPEADVRTTKDNVIICFHDADLQRICPDLPADMRKKGLDEMTLEEVEKIDVGKLRGKPGQKVPTLEEVFQQMSGRPERFVYLDYKYIDMTQLAAMVKKYGIEKQIIFANKSYNLIMQWKQLVPQSQTLLWMGGTQRTINKKLDELRIDNFKGITSIQFHYIKDVNEFNVSDDFILKEKKEFEERGIMLQILPWKINDPTVFEKLMNLGIESFATDYPDVLLPVYEKKLKD